MTLIDRRQATPCFDRRALRVHGLECAIDVGREASDTSIERIGARIAAEVGLDGVALCDELSRRYAPRAERLAPFVDGHEDCLTGGAVHRRELRKRISFDGDSSTERRGARRRDA